MKRLEEVIAGARSIAITGHVRPDGDCVGSCLGLYNYISHIQPEAQAQVYLEPFATPFSFLKGADKIRKDCSEDHYYDVCFALDCSDFERLGEAGKYFAAAKQKVCIDHHITNAGYGDINWIQADASSTSELLYTFMEDCVIDLAVAECLYLGIVHDTGVFKHSNTAGITMEIAGKLLEKGVSSAYIIDETFYKKTFAQNKVLGRALDSACLWLDGAFIAGVVSKEDMESCGLEPKDLDGNVDQLRITSGVAVAAFLYEADSQGPEYKVSLRANGEVDVSRIAMGFGGGGHVKAAGCTVTGQWKQIAEILAELVAEQLGVLSH